MRAILFLSRIIRAVIIPAAQSSRSARSFGELGPMRTDEEPSPRGGGHERELTATLELWRPYTEEGADAG